MCKIKEHEKYDFIVETLKKLQAKYIDIGFEAELEVNDYSVNLLVSKGKWSTVDVGIEMWDLPEICDYYKANWSDDVFIVHCRMDLL